MKKGYSSMSFLLLTAALLSLLTSCYTDGTEVDDQVYTLVMGCDRGVDNSIRITIQFPTYKGGAGGGGGGPGSGGGSGDGGGGGSENKSIVGNTIVETVDASSILEGMNVLNTSTTRRISFVHTKAIVFSESLAKEGIERFLEPISRFREARRIMQVVVCKGTAEDFIRENKSNIGESIAKAMELASTQADNSGLFPKVTFQTFYTGILSPYSQAFTVYAGLNDMSKLKPIPDKAVHESPLITKMESYPGDVPRMGDRKIEFLGTGVFNGDKLIGTLSSYETRFFMMIRGEYEKGIMTMDDRNSPGKAIVLDLRLGRKPKIKASFENGVPVITVELNVEADLGAIQSRFPYENLDKISELNEQIRSMVLEGADKVIKKAQEYNSDIFGFGRAVAKNFLTVTEFEKYNWLSHFKDAQIKVEVTANVRRTGLMYHSVPIRDNKEPKLSGGESS